jgi:S-adenosylmethionine decarboxylase proenzyme
MTLHPSQRRHVAGRLAADPALLDDDDALACALREAVIVAGATVIGEMRYPFRPLGVTVVLVLAESHASVHTWPEEGVAEVDVFTCGDTADPKLAFDEFAFALSAVVLSQVIIETE